MYIYFVYDLIYMNEFIVYNMKHKTTPEESTKNNLFFGMKKMANASYEWKTEEEEENKNNKKLQKIRLIEAYCRQTKYI